MSFVVLEAGERLGGILRTERRDGFLIERSADMFTTREPWALELCEQLGLADSLLPTCKEHRGALVLRDGRLHRVPLGFTLMAPTRLLSFLKSPLLSWRGKLRVLRERWTAARRDSADESLESFVRRRFGDESFERLVQPLIGGIYTADPQQLSMQATMRQFVELERQHGSVIRGLSKAAANTPQASGARYGQFLAPRDGMSQLVEALGQSLPPESIRLGSPVDRLTRGSSGQWQLRVGERDETFDGVVLALPAPRVVGLLQPHHKDLASELAAIPYAGAAVAVLGYARKDIRHPLDAFGLVVPAVEQRKVLAVSFASVKFPGRAADDQVLIRVFMGGALQPELLEQADDELLQLARQELEELLGARGTPRLAELHRWQGAMPQYHVGHLDRVERIEAHLQTLPGLQLAGNAYRGVGIPFCIRSGQQAADRLLAAT